MTAFALLARASAAFAEAMGTRVPTVSAQDVIKQMLLIFGSRRSGFFYPGMRL